MKINHHWGVPSPQLLALSSSSVNVMQFNPSVPSGIITAYNVMGQAPPSSSIPIPLPCPSNGMLSSNPTSVITAYTLHHRVPSLKSQSAMWAPPSTATVQFHTYNPSGILFYQINSVMTDFLGVKLHGGLPWLIFDVGSGPAVVESNSTRTFNDGQWHTSPPVGSSLCDGQGHVVLFEQASNTFYVTMDTVHTAAITAAIVPLLTMKVYFEGFPSTSSRYGICNPLQHVSYPLLNALDGFDAVLVQNVGSTNVIVSWNLPTHIMYMYTSRDISGKIKHTINPDKSFGSSDPMCILLLQLSSLLVEHTAPNIHDSNRISCPFNERVTPQKLDTVLPKATPIIAVVAK
eukprot:Em0012g453a